MLEEVRRRLELGEEFALETTLKWADLCESDHGVASQRLHRGIGMPPTA